MTVRIFSHKRDSSDSSKPQLSLRNPLWYLAFSRISDRSDSFYNFYGDFRKLYMCKERDIKII